MAAARKKARKAGDAFEAARSSPYVQRIIDDPQLREDIRDAIATTRKAYSRLSNGKAPAKALMEDRKLQKQLREAAISLRDVGIQLREGPKRKRRLGRKLFLLVAGAGLALALSEGLRKKVLDALFGAEEEFDYTSTTTPAPAPETTGAAA
jgi:hypothetical protein